MWDIKAEQQVNEVPCFFVYQKGEKVDELVGASVENLEELIQNYNLKFN